MTAKFVTIDKVAKHFSVSVSTIRSWIRNGYIPPHTYIKPSNTYRFNIEAVEAALTEGEKDEVKITGATGEATASDNQIKYQLDLFDEDDEGDLS